MTRNGHRPRLLPFDAETRRARLGRWRRRILLWPIIGAAVGGLVAHVLARLGWWPL